MSKTSMFEFQPSTTQIPDLVTISKMKISKALYGIDKDAQIQSLINPDIYFKRNSINLLISRRGIGKTYAVMNELVKLSLLPENGGYSQFIYVTEKVNDSIVQELINLVTLKTRVVKYEDALEVLRDIISAKTAYEQVITNHLEKDLTESSKADVLKTLDIINFTSYIPNTAILIDDAINILKEPKYRRLVNLIFQNRQPRFTFFICCQDSFGIPPSIKRNVDIVWIFSGFTDRMIFNTMVRQFGSPVPGNELWLTYSRLGEHDSLVLDFESGRIKLNYVINGRKYDLDKI
jgi:hypothetical protein